MAKAEANVEEIVQIIECGEPRRVPLLGKPVPGTRQVQIQCK